MKKQLLFLVVATISIAAHSQVKEVMTPEQLITLNRVSGHGITEDGKMIVYSVSQVNIDSNKRYTKYYTVPIGGGDPTEVKQIGGLLRDKNVSADGSYSLSHKAVKMHPVYGTDHYPELSQSNMMIYNDLNYRHWDTWEDGEYDHVFLTSKDKKVVIDLMQDEPHDCPTKPFGGDEDYIFSPDSKSVLYVTKKSSGKYYAVSTNTDIYKYDIATGQTVNLTSDNLGYDMAPAFSVDGKLAFLRMKRDGYESDKNDIVVDYDGKRVNLTEKWDGTVNGFLWSSDSKSLYFTAPVGGTVQLFVIDLPKGKEIPMPRQITDGMFDVRGIVGQTKGALIITKGDMNHASELYSVNLKKGTMTQLTHANDEIYNRLHLSRTEKRIIKTVDGKDMVTWVIYPPDFDSTKTYPTLLYCQGGPQGALSQFYSYRWNFQLMAAQGYIVVAPNRRGMPGHGVEWNEQISKDYGGLNMKDYLSAIDALAAEPYVDNNRLGCVGASYGGYSAFYLAAIHEGRFKTFIAHDGIFNWKSMYGTTEELFFVNWDLGGPYWMENNKDAQKAYTVFNPVEHVQKWDSPIMIIQGGLDFRVPIGQGLEAFQAAQLQGLNSRLLYFPEENHWVLDYQNSLIWHREFYKWLEETL